VVTVDKVDRINRALDEQKRAMDQILLRNRRPALGHDGERMSSLAALEHKAAFDAYVRRGAEDGLRSLEQKALAVSTNSGADGGYTVPDEVEKEIGRRLASLSPIRAISSVRQISANVYKKAFSTTAAATGWVAETDSRPQTSTPTLAELQFPAMELYAMPAATGTLLDDSAVNIDEWIASEVEQAFATQEGYNAGYGVRSLDDIHAVIAFFEERRGRLYGFRWKDRADFQSCAPGETPAATDQAIGTGDGATLTFHLAKTYGGANAPWTRAIAKPVTGTVLIAVGGTPAAEGWTVDTTNGQVTFTSAPADGAAITAGFQFDVPVRFDTDKLTINLTNFAAGEVPAIPLVEIRL
jgi:uncharacterized protein (TIGR02217 family)